MSIIISVWAVHDPTLAVISLESANDTMKSQRLLV